MRKPSSGIGCAGRVTQVTPGVSACGLAKPKKTASVRGPSRLLCDGKPAVDRAVPGGPIPTGSARPACECQAARSVVVVSRSFHRSIRAIRIATSGVIGGAVRASAWISSSVVGSSR